MLFSISEKNNIQIFLNLDVILRKKTLVPINSRRRERQMASALMLMVSILNGTKTCLISFGVQVAFIGGNKLELR